MARNTRGVAVTAIKMDILLFICLAISFLSSVFLTHWWIKRAHKAKLVSPDVHKPEHHKVANIGGIPVVASFLISILLYVGYRTFVLGIESGNVEILGVVGTVLIITIIGIVDDILGWKIGLKQWQKPLLCLFAALPMMMINIGSSTMNLPFIGTVNFGIIYPLILVPIGIAGAANAFNMIGGYNGMEAGMGIIILGSLGLVTWIHEDLGLVAMISGAMMMALIGFIIYNWYPAKVFPGNTLTYAVGAVIASVAILGNVEKMAVILLAPYFIEFVLKARGKFEKESFAKLSYGGLGQRYDGIYALEHIAVKIIKKIRGFVHEEDVVILMLAGEVVLAFTYIVYLFS